MNRELIKQIKQINKKERRILNKGKNTLFKSTINPIKGKIEEKIPDKLIFTLEAAFYKGFQLVFEKGHVYIEKTYNKDKLRLEHDLNDYALDKNASKKYIKRLDKQAKTSKRINTGISIIEGGILGVLGIGLPDIPLFISVIMKTIYEIAISYGYGYETEEEKVYILLLICSAMSEGHIQEKFNEQADKLGLNIDNENEIEIYLEDQVKTTAIVLSDAMLTAKFIQGIPIIGAVGGIVNYNIIKKIGKYSGLKYKKRYLLKKARYSFE